MNPQDKIEILQAIHEIHVDQVKMRGVLQKNTDDVEKHIKRTDLLEKKVGKIYQFAIFSAGIIAAYCSPEIIKLLGALL